MINFFYFGDFEEVMDFVGDVLRDSESLLHHLVTLEIVSENCKEESDEDNDDDKEGDSMAGDYVTPKRRADDPTPFRVG